MSVTLTQHPTAVEDLSIPSELESPKSKLVYLLLNVEGEATINEITNSLGMKKLSLYPTLSELTKEGFIQQNGETYSFSTN